MIVICVVNNTKTEYDNSTDSKVIPKY